MAKNQTPADAVETSTDQAPEQTQTAGADLAVDGNLVVAGAVGGELPAEIVEQLEQAADNLEAARLENANLKSELEASKAAADGLAEALKAEQDAHATTRGQLAMARAILPAHDDELGDDTLSPDDVADGLYVMLTSKIPDETGALAPRGRLAIIGDERAPKLVDEGHARPATRADVEAAKRPPVRI